MLKSNEGKESMCLLYVSDYHFGMICLPYIRKCLQNNEGVEILTQRNLEGEVSKILTNMDLNNEERNEIININWKNKNEEQIKNIKDENKVVFIKGEEEYIKKLNKNFENYKNIQIIDCYNIEKMDSNIIGVIEKYNKILSTKGVEKIK